MIGQWTANWAKENKLSFKYFETVSSTSDIAKDSNEESLDLVLADTQTMGRGRGANTWASSKQGSQLLSSWVFYKDTPAQPVLSPLTGLHIYRALKSKFPGLIWNVKAPNDIYINDKKVGGILIENISLKKKQKIIIGLGINVLDHPRIDKSGSIQSEWPSPITENEWKTVLHRLHHELGVAVSAGLQDKINPLAAAELCQALNLNPGVKSPFLKVLPDGSLRTAEKTVPWTDL